MGMKAPLLSVALATAALAAPVHSLAAGALGQARSLSSDPAGFDGAAVKPEGTPVPAGATEDRRTAQRIAMDEQAKADARAAVTTTAPGPDAELEAPKTPEWRKQDHIVAGAQAALVGLLIGSLWGMTGLGIGLVVGGLIGYALSRVMS